MTQAPVVQRQQLLAALDINGAMRHLARIVDIPSPTGAEDVLANDLVEHLRATGATDVHKDATGNVVLTLRGAIAGPTWLFVTHMDHAAASPGDQMPPSWSGPGDRFGKTGNVVAGPGACAPKAAIAAVVAATIALRRVGLPRRGAIVVALLTRDLDSDHASFRRLLSDSGIRADAVVACETTGNRLFLAARGIAQFVVRIAGKSQHRGRPHDGTNALYAAGAVLGAVERMELPADAALGRATLTPFDASTDARPPLAPATVSISLDRRTLPGEDPLTIAKELRAVADEAIRSSGRDVDVQIEVRQSLHPFRTDPSSRIVDTIQEAVTYALGARLESTVSTFGSNAGFAVTEMGWPAVSLGPGNIADLGPSEHVAVAEVERGAQIYASGMAYADLRAD